MKRESRENAASKRASKSPARDERYLAFLECFNRQRFYEAHKVLESLWREERQGSDGQFYKGLIQLAGAFVHVQRGWPNPGRALMQLARTNLARYRPVHQRLEVDRALEFIAKWLQRLETKRSSSPDMKQNGPTELKLRDRGRR